MDALKLNAKRTIFVGFAFFLISAFWVAYDAIIPLILVNRFGMSQTFSGGIMALDNVFALVLLPLFGALSDKCKSKMGKRTPFVLIGTVVAVIAFFALTFFDNYQLARIIEAGVADIYDPENASAQAQAIAIAWELTTENPLPLIGFIATLLVVLTAMSVFRSPAVALMPDVTVKPLRSKGNAIINLMGTAGGIVVMVLGMVFGTSKNIFMQYTWYMVAVVAVMIVSLVLFLFLVKEQAWSKEAEHQQARLDELSPQEEEQTATEKLSKPKLISLLLILSSVFFWYMGYNGVTTKFSLYATNVLQQDFNFVMIIAQAAAVIAFIPVGILAGKLGRKKTILIGVALLAAAFLSGVFVTSDTPDFVLYIVFVVAGVGWATINVNSFPMVVELAKGSNVGKYTGYYYTASMAAQVLTPLLSGALMDGMGTMEVLFPYATICVVCSFVTMLFVRHGNAQELGGKTSKQLIEENFAAED